MASFAVPRYPLIRLIDVWCHHYSKYMLWVTKMVTPPQGQNDASVEVWKSGTNSRLYGR